MIYYASRTGNVKYIIDKLGNVESCDIKASPIAKCEFFLFTYTDGLGNIPDVVNDFMGNNHTLCKGVICSGNSNFGHHVFCGASEKLNKQYGIPIIRNIELRGFQHDYDYVMEKYDEVFRKG